jgi:predicted nucleic acid-binding Zn ribbon protein
MEQKEEFCTVCSVPVPSAFSNDDGNDIEEKNRNRSKFMKFILNNCNIVVYLLIAIVIYLIFFYKK